jgi:hypothetical protein
VALLVGALLGIAVGLFAIRSRPQHCHIQSRCAKLVATVLSRNRCYVSGVLGMAAQERTTSCCSLIQAIPHTRHAVA